MKEIIILHDSDGRPYYKAVESLARSDLDLNVCYRESSILRLCVKAILKRTFDKTFFHRIVQNLLLRFRLPSIENKFVIMGMAPYDFRIIWYRKLIRKNTLIMHTSWPYWGTRAPRRYWIFNKLFMAQWRAFLKEEKLKIVAVTSSVRNSLINNYDINGMIRTIPHSVDNRVFYPRSNDRSSNEVLKVLYVGKMIKEKGLDVLSAVIKRSDSSKYNFGLVGKGEYLKNLNDVLKKKNVSYFGYVSNEHKLADIYRKHDVLLLPSIRTRKWEELFGIVILEAMSSGLAVIASRHVGPCELIQNGTDGFLVEEGNPVAILRVLSFLYKNPNRLNIISRNARNKIIRKYSLEKISHEWREILFE